MPAGETVEATDTSAWDLLLEIRLFLGRQHHIASLTWLTATSLHRCIHHRRSQGKNELGRCTLSRDCRLGVLKGPLPDHERTSGSAIIEAATSFHDPDRSAPGKLAKDRR